MDEGVQWAGILQWSVNIGVVILCAWAMDVNIQLRVHKAETNHLREKVTELAEIVKRISSKTKVF